MIVWDVTDISCAVECADRQLMCSVECAVTHHSSHKAISPCLLCLWEDVAPWIHFAAVPLHWYIEWMDNEEVEQSLQVIPAAILVLLHLGSYQTQRTFVSLLVKP